MLINIKRKKMITWNKGDIVYYIFSNGDKAECKCLEFDNKGNMWVEWLKDGFVNIMPCKKFVKTNNCVISEIKSKNII